MTSETLTEPREPIEARVLNAVYLLLGSVSTVAILWHVLDPGAPLEWLEAQRERWNEHRRYRRAMAETLADIGDLPERQEYSSGARAADEGQRITRELDDELDDKLDEADA